MSRQIVIDPVTRIEGHAKITLQLDDDGNVHDAMFHVTQRALPHLRDGARIINTASVTAYRGSPHLFDYASTKGAIVAFTRSLALALVERGIRVNAVAPGPVWTPLVIMSFPAEKNASSALSNAANASTSGACSALPRFMPSSL